MNPVAARRWGGLRRTMGALDVCTVCPTLFSNSDPTPPLSQVMPGLAPAVVQRLRDMAQISQLPRRGALVSAGQAWQQVVWVQQGVLRLYYLDRDGQESVKNFFLDGGWCWPITPTLADQPVAFFIEALEPTRLCLWPWLAWSALLADEPAWARWQQLTLARLLDDKLRREQQFLQCSAQARYDALCQAHPDWLARVPLRQLASYLGMTDVSLSRLRRRAREGLNPG